MQHVVLMWPFFTPCANNSIVVLVVAGRDVLMDNVTDAAQVLVEDSLYFIRCSCLNLGARLKINLRVSPDSMKN